jgi:hypothetical protein
VAEARALLAQFERAHGEIVEFVRACSLAEWRAVCAAEGWPVSAVVGHIADGYTTSVEWTQEHLAGRPVRLTQMENDARNAARAPAGARLTPEEAIDLLENRAGLVRAVVGGLSDEQLLITQPIALAGGREVTVGQLTGILTRHITGHLTSCRAATSEPWSPPLPE